MTAIVSTEATTHTNPTITFKTLNEKQKLVVVKKITAAAKKSQNLTEACKMYGVSRSTYSTWVKNNAPTTTWRKAVNKKIVKVTAKTPVKVKSAVDTKSHYDKGYKAGFNAAVKELKTTMGLVKRL